MNDPDAIPPPPPPGWGTGAPVGPNGPGSPATGPVLPPPTADASRGWSTGTRIRWGLGDFGWVIVAGLFVGLFAGVIGAALAGAVKGAPLARDEFGQDPFVVASTALGQFGAWFGGIWLVSRSRGLGRLSADFGFAVRGADAWAFVLGIALQIGLSLFLLPISHLPGAEQQSIVDDIQAAAVATRVALAVTAVLLAPVVEELLFRGLLLRGLLRRLPAGPSVAISGVVFGITHVLDPSALASLPALCVVGIVSGALAVRSGRLSQSMLLHAGFNAIGVVLILVR